MKLTITRFNPSVDAKPYDQVFDVPTFENMTLLEAVMYVHENLEPISFDYTCRGRLCGRCSVMYDGIPVFACIQFVSEGSHTVAPLEGFPVIRDLIVDKRREQKAIADTYERVRIAPLTREEINSQMTTEAADKLRWIEYCCRCQVCTVICPAKKDTPQYMGPSRLLAVAYRHFDPYDQADRLLEAVAGGLWDCQMCGSCTKVCQNSPEIHHLDIWKELRADATARGLTVANPKGV
ncbi:MAG: hypothetical protein LBG81_09285 [Coriobacteriaceae bacterium]|jgi:succinate dehydrogenase/fumarate reductase iron-sulfur protein|nr:hypothetical protein [Coriobacteriaceae bacterium]